MIRKNLNRYIGKDIGNEKVGEELKTIDKISELMRMSIPSKSGYFIKSRDSYGDKITLGIAKSDEQWMLRQGKILWFKDWGEVREYIVKEWGWEDEK